MRMLRLLLFALVLIGVAPEPARSLPAATGRLVVVTPGILAAADEHWRRVSTALGGSTRTHWVIRTSEGSYPPVPQGTRVIEVSRSERPEVVRRLLQPILESDSATVTVDMNLTFKIPGREGGAFFSSWAPQTSWAAGVITMLGRDYVTRHPQADTTWIGHSAGTEPMMMVSPTIATADGGRRPLFEHPIVMSGRNADAARYPPGSLIVFADGDFAQTPDGSGMLGALLHRYGPDDAVRFANQGYRVLRIEHTIGGETDAARPDIRHSESNSVDLSDFSMVFYERNSMTPHPFPQSVTLATAINVSVATQGEDETIAQIDRIRAREPTPGLGGISLNAAARMPMPSSAIASAGYDAEHGRLYIRLRSGAVVWLPQFDPEVLSQTYNTTYRLGERAELSIGESITARPGGGHVVSVHANNFSVYYFGHIRDTLQGRVLFEADSSLSDLAFGGPDVGAEVAQSAPGFHTLPELFPEKYTDNPQQARLLAGGQRIFITPGVIELSYTGGGGSLVFSQTGFNIQFAHTEPAESAYARFLEDNFAAVTHSAHGQALGRLVPYARASAIFRWLLENHISFEPGSLAQTSFARVLTPSERAEPGRLKLADVHPRAPVTIYGEFGPAEIMRDRFRTTRFAYQNGRFMEAQRSDGQRFTVYRTASGAAVGYHAGWWTNTGFIVDPHGGLLLARGVQFVNSNGGWSARLNADAKVAPISNIEPIIMYAAQQFAVDGDVP